MFSFSLRAVCVCSTEVLWPHEKSLDNTLMKARKASVRVQSQRQGGEWWGAGGEGGYCLKA